MNERGLSALQTGSFLIADVAEASATADRVTGEVTFVVYEAHCKQLKREGLWPAGFDEPEAAPVAEAGEAPRRAYRDAGGSGDDDASSSDDGQPPLEANTNRRQHSVGTWVDHAAASEGE